MTGITQKSCVALFPLCSLKKTFFFGGGGGGGGGECRRNVNKQKQTKRVLIDKKSCQYDDNCNNNWFQR